jgi:hypothetical protein
MELPYSVMIRRVKCSIVIFKSSILRPGIELYMRYDRPNDAFDLFEREPYEFFV